MKNRASSHLLVLFLIVCFEVVGYYGLHRAALIRGYETSWVAAVRDLFFYVPIVAYVFWLSRVMKFAGNWTLYTTAILLFSIGLLVQYRLYSDPEYNARNKAEARAQKTTALRMRFIEENYDEQKKQMMGLPPTPPKPVSLDEEQHREADYTIGKALTSGATWIPI